jgi:SAM-dependent methyltransferase
MDDIRAGFKARGPWVTGFKIDGQWSGGVYPAEDDFRLREFRKRFPRPQRVLDLGSLEGGHTFQIAKFAGHVTAIEGRLANIEKSRWLQGALGIDNVEFRQEDLETSRLASLGRFDVVFNVGLLYHLANPADLLGQLAMLSDFMFLWTHVARAATTNINGYDGEHYAEHGMADPLSGLGATSFWPTPIALDGMLSNSGFRSTEVIQRDDYANYPSVLMLCTRG